jgi:hypothetical protein
VPDILSELGPETIFPLFLSIFTLMGALSIGSGLRGFFTEQGAAAKLKGGQGILTGVIFVGAAIFMGSKAIGPGMRIMGIRYAPFQIGLAMVAAASIFLLGDSLAPVFRRPDILIGAGLFIGGLGAAGLSIRRGGFSKGFSYGLLAAGLGGFILVRGLLKMVRGDPPGGASG